MNDVSSNHLVKQARRLFGDVPCRLQVAALPWRPAKGSIEIMLVTSRESGRWILPKGWAERGEALHEAAAREAREEAGIKGAISRQDAGRFLYSKVKASGLIACEVVVYPLRVSAVANHWKEEAERNRKWVSPAEAASRVHEPDLGSLLLAFGENFTRFAA